MVSELERYTSDLDHIFKQIGCNSDLTKLGCLPSCNSNQLTSIIFLFFPEDFSLVHTNRESKRGGGVGFFIKSALDFKTIHSPEFSSHENHTVCLTLDGSRLFLGVIYRPPASSVVNFLKIFCHMWVFCLPYPPPLSFVVTLIFMSTLCLQQSLNLNQ